MVARVNALGGAAWPAFIETYSDFILGCVSRIASEPDERMDIYVHICSRLQADDCRRLTLFKGRGATGPCRFTTWLATVILNLSREWIRTAKGRRRMFKPIARLGLIDQLAFRYHYWEKYPEGQVTRVLRVNHGLDVKAEDVESAFTRIRDALTTSHRWRLVAAQNRACAPARLDRELPDGRTRAAWVRHPGPSAETQARRAEAQRLLRRAIRRLEPLERRALELRFARGLSAKQTASELGIDNYKRVYEIQARALVKLRRRLRRAGVCLADFGRALDATELLR